MTDQKKLIAVETNLGTIELVPVVRAKWQKQWCDNNMIGHEYEECPVCGCMILDTEKFWDCKFCPNCGADMREGN